MAFWDDLSRKASAATSKAVQKAQGLSETARLNGMISDEEKKINAVYSQIGKLYVELHREDGEEAFSELLETIQDAEERISSCRKQIQDMKRTLRCEKCGAEVSGDSAFCSACGAQIVQEKEAGDSSRCKKCGAPVTDWMRFCTVCGNPLPQSVNAEDTGGNGVENPQLVISDVVGDSSATTEKIDEPLIATTTKPEDVKMAVAEPMAVVETREGIIQLSEESAENDLERHPQLALSNVPQAAKRICPHCGAEIDDDQLFCIECGNSL